MKDLKEHILEGLKIGAKTKVNTHKYYPKTNSELTNLIRDLVRERGNDADLNDIDVSEVTDMAYLFSFIPSFNGDISKWNVSNVKHMPFMFQDSKFDGDISEWDVSNVKTMYEMFRDSKFNGDISNWDVSNVEHGGMAGMFNNSPLEKNPPKWYKE